MTKKTLIPKGVARQLKRTIVFDTRLDPYIDEENLQGLISHHLEVRQEFREGCYCSAYEIDGLTEPCMFVSDTEAHVIAVAPRSRLLRMLQDVFGPPETVH